MKTVNFQKLQRLYLGPRKNETHKGDYGHVMLVGGDFGMAGAVRMAAEAAMRVGAGLASIISHPEHAGIINATRPELLTPLCHKPNKLAEVAKKGNVLAIGPGLGRNYWGESLFQHALEIDVPKVIDADALFFLAKKPHKSENWILTPHPKEAARLLQSTVEEIQKDRKAAVEALQKQYGGIAILKGYGSLIKAPRAAVKICKAGNPGMASAGMGDVLTGIIAGLLAQKLPLGDAAALGVNLHALAGDAVAAKNGQRGMLASDLFSELQNLCNQNES